MKREEWGVMKDGALCHLQGSDKLLFKRHVAEVIQRVSGDELVRLAIIPEKGKG